MVNQSTPTPFNPHPHSHR